MPTNGTGGCVRSEATFWADPKPIFKAFPLSAGGIRSIEGPLSNLRPATSIDRLRHSFIGVDTKARVQILSNWLSAAIEKDHITMVLAVVSLM